MLTKIVKKLNLSKNVDDKKYALHKWYMYFKFWDGFGSFLTFKIDLESQNFAHFDIVRKKVGHTKVHSVMKL